MDADEDDLIYESALPVREQIADLLDAAQPQAGSGYARFQAVVTVYDDDINPGMFIPPVFLFIPFGYFTTVAEIEVSIRIETDKSVLVGAGSAKAKGSVFASAYDRALVTALHEALADAKPEPRQARARSHGSNL